VIRTDHYSLCCFFLLVSAALDGNKYRNKENKPKKQKEKDESGVNVKFNYKTNNT
jgi:hypothetical protein